MIGILVSEQAALRFDHKIPTKNKYIYDPIILNIQPFKLTHHNP